MSCFDIDYLTPVANRNETNHFHIVLNGESNLQVDERGKIKTDYMSVKEYGIFLHEYIHYMQHLITLFGINRCKMFNIVFGQCIQYVMNKQTVRIPIKLSTIDVNYHEYETHIRKTFGIQHYSKHYIDEVEVNDNEIIVSKLENRSVRIGIYDFQNNEALDNEIEFGYWGIIESMAHLVQQMIEPEIDNFHREVTYRLVELICRNKYPSIANDSKMMIAVCLCALMFDNPGVAFFDVADYAKEQKIDNGIVLYSHIMEENYVNYKNKNIPLYEAIILFLEELINSIETVIGEQASYLRIVAQSCKIEAQKKQSHLLNMIYNPKCDFKKDSLSLLSEFYGFPLIQAKNVFVLPNKSSKGQEPYRETARLLGVEILYKRLMGKSSTCLWYEICRLNQDLSQEQRSLLSNDLTSIECLYDQWNKTEICMMTQALSLYGIKDKYYVQNKET